MREAIRRAVKGLFPELGAGLHLDRYARVLAVADARRGRGRPRNASARAMPWTSRYSRRNGEPESGLPDLYGGPPSRADRGGAGERLFQLPGTGRAGRGRVRLRKAGSSDHPANVSPRRVASRGGAGRTALAEHPRRLPAGGRWRQLDAGDGGEDRGRQPGARGPGPDVRGRTRHGNADHPGALQGKRGGHQTDRGHNLVACGRAAGGSSARSATST